MIAFETDPDICSACGAKVQEGRAGCRKIFEEVLVRDYSDYRYGRSHRLLVDVYSLQHPDDHMRSGKSFAAHLTGICAVLEYDDPMAINAAVQKWLNGRRTIAKPSILPHPRSTLTIVDVHAARDPASHHKVVQEWAQEVWQDWSDYHSLARDWINDLLVDPHCKTD
jgi:Family of unknown function (DUF5946)